MKKTLTTLLTLAGLLTPTLFAHADITSNLLSWYKFDEGTTGATVIDSGSASNNGTEVANPTYITGKVGPYALSLDGVNQFIETTNASSYNFTSTNFTLSAWINTTANGGV